MKAKLVVLALLAAGPAHAQDDEMIWATCAGAMYVVANTTDEAYLQIYAKAEARKFARKVRDAKTVDDIYNLLWTRYHAGEVTQEELVDTIERCYDLF